EIETRDGALAPRGGPADLVLYAAGLDAVTAATTASLRGVRELYVIDVSADGRMGGPPLVLLEQLRRATGPGVAFHTGGGLRDLGHDRAVATGDGLDFFHDQAADAVRLHAEWLSAEEKDALAALPQVTTVDRFTLCHGSLRDPLWEYVTTTAAASATIARASTRFACCGHTHLPAM